MDLRLLISNWGTRAGGPNWDAKFDLNSDGIVDTLDLRLLISNWGKTVSSAGSSSQQEVTISAGTTPVTEGTSATFTITASSAPTSALTVNVNVTQTGDVISGTASSTVTIDANQTSATLTVATDDDAADETNGVVTAEVQSGTGYTVGSTSSASVTVEDNDDPRLHRHRRHRSRLQR